MLLGGHSAFSDKSGSLSLTSSIDASVLSPRSRLHNPDFSSKILECPASHTQDSKTDLESSKGLESRFKNTESKINLESRFTKSHTDSQSNQILESSHIESKAISESQVDSESAKNLESRFKNIDSNLESNATESEIITESNPIDLESKKLIESTTLQNPNKALPDSNNGCDSTNRAESKTLDSAIFAEQKSDSNMSHEVHTDTRPLRGAQSLEQGGSSALRNDCARSGESEALPLIAEKKKRRFILFGALASGEGINPFSFCDTQDSKKLENIREKEILRNEEIQNLDLQSNKILESNPIESKTDSESRFFIFLESLILRIFPRFSTSLVLCERGEGLKLRSRSLPPLNLSPHPDDAFKGCSARDNVTGKPCAESKVDSESKKSFESSFIKFQRDSESTKNLDSRFKDLALSLESNPLDSADSTTPTECLESTMTECLESSTSGFLLSVFEIGSNILEHNFYHHKLSHSSKHRYWRDKHALRRHKIICKIAPKQVAFVFRPKYLRSFQKARNYTNGRGMLLVFRFSKVSLARISHKVCLRVSYGADRGDFKDSLARWHTSTKNHRQSEDIRHIFRLQTRARVLYPGFYQQR